MLHESEEIYKAELSRIKGDRMGLAEAIKVARDISNLTPDQIVHSTATAMVNHMRRWRIWEASLQTLASIQWNGNEAAKFLHEARDLIKVYYYHPRVWEMAKDMWVDPEGHEYYMAAEMCRDEGRYYQKSHVIKGSKVFLVKALAAFQEAADLSDPSSSVHSLADIEQQVVLRRLDPNRYDFSKVSHAYLQVEEQTYVAKNWDRLAAVSWTFTMEALASREFEVSRESLMMLKRVTANMNKNWTDYPKKAILGRVLNATQRITARSIDEQQFFLS